MLGKIRTITASVLALVMMANASAIPLAQAIIETAEAEPIITENEKDDQQTIDSEAMRIANGETFDGDYLRGDVDLDGKVTQTDATIILRESLIESVGSNSILDELISEEGKKKYTENYIEMSHRNGDVDYSDNGSKFSQTDATFILRVLLESSISGENCISDSTWNRNIEYIEEENGMANVNALVRIMDENNNVNSIYPTTKAENVEGLQTALNTKVDKVTGKGLSTNDYTTAEKNKLSGIEAQANKTIISTSIPATPTDDTVPSMKLVDDNYASNSDLAAGLALKADASTVSSISSQVSTNTTNIATQTSRIDAIAALPSGSTSGDAELIDIRTMTNGKTANNAGTAVRTQITNLSNDVFKDFSEVYETHADLRLEPDGTYSNTQGYTVFEYPPKVTNGDKIVVTFTDKNANLADASIRYMFASDNEVYASTYVADAGNNDPSGNLLIIDVPATPAPITQMFMSFSSDVASVIKVYKLSDEFKTFYSAYGSAREQRIVSNIILMDENIPATIAELKDNTMYRINILTAVSWLPASIADGQNYFIESVTNSILGYSNAEKLKVYTIFDNDFKPIYHKEILSDGTEYSWRTVDSLMYSDIIMNSSGVDNVPSAITDLKPETYYRLQLTNTVSWLPSGYSYDGNTRFIIRFTNTYSGGNYDTFVIFDNNLNPIYRKSIENGIDYQWHDLVAEGVINEKTIFVGQNEAYTKLTDALAYAYSTGNTKIILRKGTYDITSELDLSTAGAGPVIGNNTTLYCEEGAEVVCNYTGNSASVKETFSPLNAGNGNYKIENLKIRCKNVRYCVHDELSSAAVQYKHEYINCDMYLDNSESSWDAPQCIGGGLGENGYIVVDGGIYDSLPADPECWSGAISYHNGYTAGCKSHIEIRNVYFKNSGARFGYYGASTQKTKVLVSNCRLSTNPVSRAETSDSVIDNMDVYAWNNEETNKVALYTDNYSIYPRTITIPKSQFNIPASATLTGAAVHRNNYNVPLSASATVSGDNVVVTISNNANADCVLYIFAIYE